MKHNKFFNENMDDEPTKNISRTNKTNDSNNILSYIILIVLGIVSIIGVIYYALEYFSTK